MGPFVRNLFLDVQVVGVASNASAASFSPQNPFLQLRSNLENPNISVN